jgi:soluble lytic murein transglycosylase-like protein
MKTTVIAGIFAALIATTATTSTAQASCADYGTCESYGVNKKSFVKKQRQATSYKATSYKVTKRKTIKIASARKFSQKRVRTKTAFAAVPRGRGNVVALITSQAPRYGVPTWFALRIARIESGYNPRARGAAGEYGVFQLKCATARGIGFRGNCGNLLNASTNVQYGLKHLQLAVRGSRGNLRLAASKHNGGLGRKSLVPKYVSRVF